MLLDLLGLAWATKLFVAPADSIGMPGGLGRLAADLNRRRDILRHFSGRG